MQMGEEEVVNYVQEHRSRRAEILRYWDEMVASGSSTGGEDRTAVSTAIEGGRSTDTTTGTSTVDVSLDNMAAIMARSKKNFQDDTIEDLTGEVIQSSLYDSQVNGCAYFTKLLQECCPGGYWYSLCLKTNFQCGEKKKSIVCATYLEKTKTYNRRDATQHVSIEEEWNKRVTTQPVSKFGLEILFTRSLHIKNINHRGLIISLRNNR